MIKGIAKAFCFLFSVVQWGCAVNPTVPPPYPSELDRTQLRSVGVVHATFSPQLQLESLLKVEKERAARGRAVGAVAGVGIVGFVAALACAANPFACPGLGPVLGGMAAGGVAGSAVGKAATQSAGTDSQVSDGQALASKALEELRAHERLRDALLHYSTEHGIERLSAVSFPGPASPGQTPDYRAFAGDKIDAILEVSILSMRTDLAKFEVADPSFRLEMTANARLISFGNGRPILLDQTYTVRSASKRFSDWVKDEARGLRETLDAEFRFLAESIVDEAFLLHGKPEDKMSADLLPFYRTPAISPETGEAMRRLPGEKREFVLADSLSPTFRWKAFPTSFDVEGVHKQPSVGVTDVRYDLRIYSSEKRPEVGGALSEVPAELIYERRGLPAPEHRIESPLASCTNYFWTFRAEFKLKSETRVTEWAGAYMSDAPPWFLRHQPYSALFPASVLVGQLAPEALVFPPLWLLPVPLSEQFFPFWFYHRFRTPCEGDRTTK